MISLHDRPSIECALSLPLDPQIHELLASRIAALLTPEGDLTDLTHFLIIQPGDREAAILEEVGFSPLVNPVDGIRFGSPGFQPYWAYLIQKDGTFEMAVTVGNCGFAFILLIPEAQGVDKELLQLCRTYAEPR